MSFSCGVNCGFMIYFIAIMVELFIWAALGFPRGKGRQDINWINKSKIKSLSHEAHGRGGEWQNIFIGTAGTLISVLN